MLFPLVNAARADPIAPSDSADLPGGRTSAGIFIGSGGAVVCDVGGVTVTFAGLPAGSVLNVAASRVRNAGTTATGLVALYQQ
jgi:hypothetical protein